MSIYGPRKSGLYGTGYNNMPGSSGVLGSLTLPDPGTAIQRTLPRLPQGESSQPEEIEADPSLLRMAADTSLSGLSMLGNALDLPGSMVRDVLTWVPGGIAARNPLDQLLTPFSDANRTSGEEMLKSAGLYDQDDSDDGTMKSIGKFLGSTAAEIALDPLTYLTLGASALGKGGKLAKAAGLLDDASIVATRKAGVQEGGKAVGKRRARQMVTARELGANIGDEGLQRLVNAYNGTLKKGAKRATSVDEIPAELLDSSIGGNMRFKLPFMDERIINDIGPISGEKIAEVGDAVAEAVRYGENSPVRLLAPYFSRAVRGTKTAFGQKEASEISRRIEEQSQLARDTSIETIKEMDAGGYFKGDDAITNSNAMIDYLEGISDELPENLAPAKVSLDRIRTLYDELDQLNTEYAVNTESLQNLGYVKRKVLNDAGEVVEEIDIPSPIKYAARNRQFATGPLWRSQHNARRMPVKDGFGIRREDYTRHLPTSVLQKISLDPEFAGVYDRGVMGRRGGFQEWFKGTPDTGVLGSTPVDDQARQALKAQFFERYDPLQYVDPAAITKADGTIDDDVVDAIREQHGKLFDSVVELNREQVEKGIPMYAINPAESLLNRLDSGYMTIASTLGARESAAKLAKLRPNSRFATGYQPPPEPQPPTAPSTLPPSPTMPVPGAVAPAASTPTVKIGKPELDVMRRTPVDQWTDVEVKTLANPESFATISDNHKTFGKQLDKLVRQKGMRKEDASIARLIFSQSDLPYMMDIVKSTPNKGMNNEVMDPGTLGAAYTLDAPGGYGKVWMKAATKSDEGARAQGVTTLIHEFAHVIWYKAKNSDNQLHRDLVSEFKTLSDAQPDSSFLDEFLSAGNTPGMASYFTHGIKGPNKKEIERFAEMMSDSLLRRKSPPKGKLGKLIEDSMVWLKDKLIKLGAIKGLDPDVRTRIDEIMDEVGGFNLNDTSEIKSDSIVDQLMSSGKLEVNQLPEAAEQTKPILGTSGSNVNLLDQVSKMGMNYGRGKEALVQQLGPDAEHIVHTLTEERLDSAADRMQGFFEKAFGDDAVDIDLGEMLRGDRETVREIIQDIDDEELAASATKLLDSLNAPISPDEVLREFEVDTDLGADLIRLNESFSGPEEATAVAAAWDTVTNLFKGNVTAPFPSFHIRNAMSAFTQNTLNGIYDPTQTGAKKFSQPYADAKNLLTGKAIKGASEIPMFADRKLTDEQATDEIRRLIFSRKLVDSPGDHNDIVGNLGGNVASQIVGSVPFAEQVKRPDGATFLDTLKPWKTPGVSGAENTFAPVRYGRAIGDMTEQVVRSAPFVALLKQGVDPDEAARMVKRLHVDYSNLTDFERKRVRRAVPFYGFQKGSMGYLASELAQKPGGPVAMTIKAGENASGNDPGTPAHIRAGMNVPLGQSGNGGQNYLVGAGLMHEAPMQLIGPSVSSTLFNFGSMLHPALKLPVELATNESLFQEGQGGGGRSLDDLDPLLGRTLTNVGNTLGITDRTNPVSVPGGKLTEAVIANSPVARYLHQVRKATDPRKDIGTKLLDSLTGFKIATVDPEDSDAVLREQAEQLMREMGGRDFSHAYLPDNVLSGLEGGELEKAQQLQALLKLLNNRQRERAKQIAN